MIRALLLTAVAMLIASTATADTADTAHIADIQQVERLAAGHQLIVAAEFGTTPDILGQGFDRTIANIGPNGQPMRVYPSTFEEVPVKQYAVSFESIENTLELNANARFLFARAGVKRHSDRRYLVLRVSYIDKVAVLRPEGPPLTDADLYATKLYYGWAFYLIIEGETSSFTRDVAMKLRTSGAALEDAVRASRLRTHVHAIGLQAKEAGAVVIATSAEQIEKQFKTPELPVPILVEYQTRRELTVQALPWKHAELLPGKYYLDLRIEVMPSKADGRAWDGGGGLPDPVVKLYIDDVLVASCKQPDSEIHLCLNGLVVDLAPTSTITLAVKDKDMLEDDAIGAAGPWQPIGQTDLNQPTFLKTHGQIKSAAITFRALN